MIITVDENDYITHGHMADNDYQAALILLALEDLRNDMREQFFEYDLEE